MKNKLLSVIVGASMMVAVIACAQQPQAGGGRPVLNVDPQRHGNIARAQELSRQAFDALTTAQEDNRYNLGGHAARAKELLQEANQQMKLAAEAANRR